MEETSEKPKGKLEQIVDRFTDALFILIAPVVKVVRVLVNVYTLAIAFILTAVALGILTAYQINPYAGNLALAGVLLYMGWNLVKSTLPPPPEED